MESSKISSQLERVPPNWSPSERAPPPTSQTLCSDFAEVEAMIANLRADFPALDIELESMQLPPFQAVLDKLKYIIVKLDSRMCVCVI